LGGEGFIMRSIGICFVFALFSSLGSAQTPAANPKGGTTMPAVRTVVILRTPATSKGAKEGKELRATLEQTTTLPGGATLPKGTQLLGSVIAVSKHSKEKPNGTLLLEFRQALVKGREPIPVLVRLERLAPSVAGEGAKVTLPNSNGNMVALANNFGGQLQAIANLNDHTSSMEKFNATSAVEGVYISATNQGSGAVFSLGEDVYLDEDIQMTVLMAPAPAKGN
jgi:hypothetical protein